MIMARLNKIEVIDLTITPEVIVIDSEEDTIPIISSANSLEKEKRLSRRKKRERAAEVAEVPVPISRELSIEDREVTEQQFMGNKNPSKSDIVGPKTQLQGCEIAFSTLRRFNFSLAQYPIPPRLDNDASDIFFFDIEPFPLPPSLPEESVHKHEESKLLLPAHVSLFENTAKIFPPSLIDSEGEENIEYLDYDDRKDLVRYFEEPTHASALKSRAVCKNCGVEGEHKTSACTIKICLTCGSHDGHSTRGCPVSKTCFNCGMKGHLNKSCPNRYSSRSMKYDDCNRCGSRNHKTNECHTLWRRYEYVGDHQREIIIRTREKKRNLGLGRGGEGYIASDEWCYNCSRFGHWGDDCQELPHAPDFPKEPSAFSIYNISSGPFFDSASQPTASTPRTRQLREWEQDNRPLENHNEKLLNVGQRGRRKEVGNFLQRAKELAVADNDHNDWFGNSKNLKSRGMKLLPFSRSCSGRKDALAGPKKMALEFSFTASTRQPRTSASSLLDRMEGIDKDLIEWRDEQSHDTKSWRSGSIRSHDRLHTSNTLRYRSRRSQRNRMDHQELEQDRERDGTREKPGPRYNGGYSK